MKTFCGDFWLAASLGLLLVLPFVVLELMFGQTSYSDFPVPLFGSLWFLAAMLIAALAPMIQTLRTGGILLVNPLTLALRIALIGVIAAFFFGLIEDQMPCFLGAPNCD